MGCKRCGKKSAEAYCDACFCLIFEKRARKNIRQKGGFMKGDSAIALCPVAQHILKKLLKVDIAVELSSAEDAGGEISSAELAYKGRKPGTVIATCRTLDTKMAEFLAELLSDNQDHGKTRQAQMQAQKNGIVNIYVMDALDVMTELEVERYAKLHKISYKKPKMDDELNFITKMSARYPSTLHSFSRSEDGLRQIAAGDKKRLTDGK